MQCIMSEVHRVEIYQHEKNTVKEGVLIHLWSCCIAEDHMWCSNYIVIKSCHDNNFWQP